MIKVRNSGVNPFLVNPIKAVLNGEDVGISHALSTGDGLHLGINYKDGKYGMVHIDAVELLKLTREGKWVGLISRRSLIRKLLQF